LNHYWDALHRGRQLVPDVLRIRLKDLHEYVAIVQLRIDLPTSYLHKLDALKCQDVVHYLLENRISILV